MPKYVLSLSLLGSCLGIILLLQWPRSDLAQRNNQILTAVPYLPKPEVVENFSFGFRSVLADYYWLEFLQYFGDTAARKLTGYGANTAYLRLVATLDPQFVAAYAAGGFAIAEAQQQPERALHFMEQGITLNKAKHLPMMWELYHRYAGVAFLYKKDYRTAAHYFEQAMQQPGAPIALQAFAAAFYRASNDWERAIPLWIDVYSSAPTLDNRERARTQLRRMGVWLNLWGARPSHLIPDTQLLRVLKLPECPMRHWQVVPLPNFQATYIPLAQIQARCP